MGDRRLYMASSVRNTEVSDNSLTIKGVLWQSGQRRIETIKCSLLAIDKLANVVDTNVGQAPQ